MRDILLLGVIAGLLALALKRPFIGLLVWAWFTIMTPHQLAYGVYGVPLNVLIAGVTLGSYVISGEITKFRPDLITILLIAFAGWLTVSQYFSLDAENSAEFYDRFIKTLLFIVLCAQMATTKLRLNALIWMLAAGIGFFAAKGAVFTIITLGQYRVYGLPDTVLEDNNHLGIATATVLPLILYLAGQAKEKYLRFAVIGLFCLSVFTILGTHSRGGLIALAAFGGLYWLYSRRKAAIAAGLILFGALGVAFMPAEWTERMETIGSATEDASFMGRVDAWIVNWKLAVDNPVTGAGLRNSYQYAIADLVDPERALRARAAHSIYFEVLGSTGFIGLFIYLGMLATAFFGAWRIYLRERNNQLAPWRAELARALQISLVVFGIGGASVSMEMWDGYLILIAAVSALAYICVDKSQIRSAEKTLPKTSAVPKGADHNIHS